jgi:hypothetical protein
MTYRIEKISPNTSYTTDDSITADSVAVEGPSIVFYEKEEIKAIYPAHWTIVIILKR